MNKLIVIGRVIFVLVATFMLTSCRQATVNAGAMGHKGNSAAVAAGSGPSLTMEEAEVVLNEYLREYGSLMIDLERPDIEDFLGNIPDFARESARTSFLEYWKRLEENGVPVGKDIVMAETRVAKIARMSELADDNGKKAYLVEFLPEVHSIAEWLKSVDGHSQIKSKSDVLNKVFESSGGIMFRVADLREAFQSFFDEYGEVTAMIYQPPNGWLVDESIGIISSAPCGGNIIGDSAAAGAVVQGNDAQVKADVTIGLNAYLERYGSILMNLTRPDIDEIRANVPRQFVRQALHEANEILRVFGEAGVPYGNDIAIAVPQVAELTRFTEPEERNGKKVSRVTFKMKDTYPEEWQRNADVRELLKVVGNYDDDCSFAPTKSGIVFRLMVDVDACGDDIFTDIFGKEITIEMFLPPPSTSWLVRANNLTRPCKR